jgi:hypothetical protein
LSVLSVAAVGGSTSAEEDPPALRAANGTKIATYGLTKRLLHLQGRKYKCKFVIANVNQAILGADLLGRNRLLVDMYSKKLVCPGEWLLIDCALRSAPWLQGICSVAQRVPLEVEALLDQFSTLTNCEIRLSPVKHNVEHEIKIMGWPFRAQFCKMSPEKLEVAMKGLAALVAMGVGQRSKSPWASPLHMMEKQDCS